MQKNSRVLKAIFFSRIPILREEQWSIPILREEQWSMLWWGGVGKKRNLKEKRNKAKYAWHLITLWGGYHPTLRIYKGTLFKVNPAGKGTHPPLHFSVTYTFQDRYYQCSFQCSHKPMREGKKKKKENSEVMKSGDRNANSYPMQCHPWHNVADWKFLENKAPVIPLQPYAGYPLDTQLALSNDASESNCFSY